MGSKQKKPHVLCVPAPAQGHINPMLKLAKILHSRGFLITFVNTEFNHQRLIRSQDSEVLRGLPSFCFETIPDGLPMPENLDASQQVASLCKAIDEKILGPFRSLLTKLMSASDSPVTYIVADAIMGFTLEAATEMDIPEILFWTSGAGSLLCYEQYPNLLDMGLMPIKVMTPEQQVEFCWGLVKSGYSFLWIIRPDLVIGDSTMLPPELLAETKSRGLLASWSPQEQVLKHQSIGGYLTHSGWNSTIESISSGVPMICWPFCGDQQTNSWLSCNKWGVAMEIDNNVKRDEVAKLVIELMNGEEGKEMRKNAIDWKNKAEEACAFPYGSSMVNMEKLIHMLQTYSNNS